MQFCLPAQRMDFDNIDFAEGTHQLSPKMNNLNFANFLFYFWLVAPTTCSILIKTVLVNILIFQMAFLKAFGKEQLNPLIVVSPHLS